MSERINKPGEAAKQGRCGAINQDGEPCICFRWRGHEGPHRGSRKGNFYLGCRAEWTDAEQVQESIR